MTLEYLALETRHTLLALALALLVAASAALVDEGTFAPVLTVGFAVTAARTVLTVLITAGTRMMEGRAPRNNR